MKTNWLMFDGNAAGGSAGSGSGTSGAGSQANGGGAANGQGNNQNNAGNGGSGQGTGNQTEIRFDEFIKTQPKEVQEAFEKHTQGLKTALGSEREQRGALEKQLKDALSKAEKGSELEKSLNEALAKLDVANMRATFAEEANKPEIGCLNPANAFIIATARELFDKRGNVNWDALKKEAPELFVKSGEGGAGQGTGGKLGTPTTVDDIIRNQAGIHRLP
jgi:hypothetical protein